MRFYYFLFTTLFCNFLFPAISQEVDSFIIDEQDTLVVSIDFDVYHLRHDHKIGKKAMPFDAVDYKGLRHRSSSYLGKILIVYFWNVWSWDVCEGQTEALNHIAEKYSDVVAIVSFVGETIQLDEFAFLQSHPVKFPIIPNSREFGFEYHGYKTGIPVLFIIDEKGYWRKVVFRSNDIEDQLKEMLKR